MSDKPLSGKPLNEWTDKELEARERDYPTGNDPLHGWNLRAEIDRRHRLRNQRYVLLSVIIAAASAFASMVAAIASWLSLSMRSG